MDRRLKDLWGSEPESSRPHVTMRGSSQIDTSVEESSTLIIRERALRGQSDRHIAVADYDLLGVLGEGGMGVVYAARQASVDREVAVKMLKPGVHNEQQRRKFLSEAAVTGELDHPNIVPIYDLGQNAEGALFYSMKKVQGTPWSKVIGEKSLLDNLSILMKAADAVAFAHARGVVHRDLKPENIMLGDFGEVLVLDWGLAVATEGHRPTPNVSAAYNIAGTPAYMAPELAIGPLERIGKHSDIYLLGAILYEIITGKPPHTGKSARDCLKAAAKNEITPTEKRGELVEIARKALATDPAERYASVKALQDALRQYQAHSESVALCERAEQELKAAHQSDDYRDFARALFAFEEAHNLWSGNQAALAGISRAKLHYAGSAHRKHDYDLGLSLVDPQHPDHAEIHERLVASKHERDARQQRLKRARQIVATLAAAVFLAVTIGIVLVTRFWLESDRQAGIARQEKEKAVEQTKIAVREKQNADIQRDKADELAGIARTNEERAKTQEQLARAAQQKAEYEAYAALISMASAKIDEHAFEQARQALVACQQLAAGRENLLGWEWQRLWYVVNQGSVVDLELPAQAECLALSPRGELLATGGFDGVVRIFNTKTRQLATEKALGPVPVKICALAFCPADENWLAIGTSDPARPLLLWNRQTQELQALGGSQRPHGRRGGRGLFARWSEAADSVARPHRQALGPANATAAGDLSRSQLVGLVRGLLAGRVSSSDSQRRRHRAAVECRERQRMDRRRRRPRALPLAQGSGVCRRLSAAIGRRRRGNPVDRLGRLRQPRAALEGGGFEGLRFQGAPQGRRGPRHALPGAARARCGGPRPGVLARRPPLA